MRRYTALPYAVINVIFDIAQFLLLLRLLAVLFEANAGHWLVQTLYGFTDPLVLPFSGIFRNAVVGGLVFEWATIIAMLMVATVHILLTRLIDVLAASAEERERRHA